MLPSMPNGMCWGLGPPNLDTMFSGLEIEVRNTVAELQSLEEGIGVLEKELALALKQRENAFAFRALSEANQELQTTAIVDTAERAEEVEQPGSVNPGIAALLPLLGHGMAQSSPPDEQALQTGGSPSPAGRTSPSEQLPAIERPSQAEQQAATEERLGSLPPGPHSHHGPCQPQQHEEASARSSAPGAASYADDPAVPDAYAHQLSSWRNDDTVMEDAVPGPQLSSWRNDDTVMEDAVPGHGSGPRDPSPVPVASPAQSADELKKRLLQVLRYLRDTATCCRDIPGLDRGFSNLLKTTYKELYDSLKELTPKGSSRQPEQQGQAAAVAGSRLTEIALRRAAKNSVASAAVASKVAAAAAATESTAAAAVAQAPAEPLDDSNAQLQPPAGGGSISSATHARDLSALARLVHAKRLYQQADGGGSGAARDPDQPAPRRPARGVTPTTSASGRVPTLYDGLPPARVAVAAGQMTASTTGREAPESTDAEPLAVQLQVQLPLAPVTASATATAAADVIAVRASGPGLTTGSQQEGRKSAPREAAGGCNDSGSPSQQLMELARASGAGVARSLLLQTAQPATVPEVLSPLQEPAQPHSNPDGCNKRNRSAGTPPFFLPTVNGAARPIQLEPLGPSVGANGGGMGSDNSDAGGAAAIGQGPATCAAAPAAVSSSGQQRGKRALDLAEADGGRRRGGSPAEEERPASKQQKVEEVRR